MRSVITIYIFAAAIVIGPGQAFAQDPEPLPPHAKVRAERAADQPAVRERRGEVRAPERQAPAVRAPENRASEGEGRHNRVPERGPQRGGRAGDAERAIERPVRVADSDAAPSRRETVSVDEAAARRAAATADLATSADDQGERRGAVRRPPSGGSGSRSGERAVPRSQAPPRPSTRTVVRSYPYRYSPYYSRYYDPWGYGSFGLGYFYYSPWAWSPYAYNYGHGAGGYYYPQYGGASGFDVGSVKIKVRQRDAEVWVDGYYAGTVDDFDGMFQALRLDSGAYRIEVRKPGFETLTFDVRVQPERTITFRGDLRPIP
jgi:hypothetical protein